MGSGCVQPPEVLSSCRGCLNPPAAPCLQLLHQLPASASTKLDTRHCRSWGDGRGSGRPSKGCSWRAPREQFDSSSSMCAGHQGCLQPPLTCVCYQQRALTLPGPSAVPGAPSSTKPQTHQGGGCHCHWHLRARCQMPRKRQRGLSREPQRRVCCCLPKLTSLTKGMILKLHHQADGLLEYGRPRNGKDE